MKPLEYCLGFHKETVTLNKGTDDEIQFNVKKMLNEPHVSTANEEVEWFPEPFFQEGHVSDI